MCNLVATQYFMAPSLIFHSAVAPVILVRCGPISKADLATVDARTLLSKRLALEKFYMVCNSYFIIP